ncbi:hypothetical protein NP493_2137g00003 [Ridgeia piscesae]|uniref:Uncharacterized protein n=1 Tax=Ridgeia piscesae TaxID=27915 RepID=A0AAD9JKK4_RIDPI|nr:hypothetical protein NP493_2137g00003 [Ridgeia piscesae]
MAALRALLVVCLVCALIFEVSEAYNWNGSPKLHEKRIMKETQRFRRQAAEKLAGVLSSYGDAHGHSG